MTVDSCRCDSETHHRIDCLLSEERAPNALHHIRAGWRIVGRNTESRLYRDANPNGDVQDLRRVSTNLWANDRLGLTCELPDGQVPP